MVRILKGSVRGEIRNSSPANGLERYPAHPPACARSVLVPQGCSCAGIHHRVEHRLASKTEIVGREIYWPRESPRPWKILFARFLKEHDATPRRQLRLQAIPRDQVDKPLLRHGYIQESPFQPRSISYRPFESRRAHAGIYSPWRKRG